MSETTDPLDRPGNWEIKITIRRNGRLVGYCDTTGHEEFASAAYWAGEDLAPRDITLHQPKPRAKRTPK